jgi:uncharacterized membrane protein HdeD (DUF308 family)
MSEDIIASAGSFRRTLRDHWRVLLFEGIVLILLGIAAIILPVLAGLAVAILFGWLFLVGGAVGLATTIWARYAPGFWWAFLSAVLWIVAGLALLIWPAGGLISFTVLLIFWFLIEGISSIMYALAHRQRSSARWGWMLFSGIIDLVLAFLLLEGLPGTAAWALGLLVGINMLFNGVSLTGMALMARR